MSINPDTPACRTCGTKRFVAMGFEYRTCVGYHSPPGHDHDDNCIVIPFMCENRHWHNYSWRRKCPACDWTSRASCSIEDHGPAFFRMPEVETVKEAP